MLTIWKFPLQLKDGQTITMPQGAKILSVGWQRNNLVLWAMVDPSKPNVRRAICMRSSGHEASTLEHKEFLGTIQIPNGGFVWHVFAG